jgi:hypothetical protein
MSDVRSRIAPLLDHFQIAVLNPIISAIYQEAVPTDVAIRLESFGSKVSAEYPNQAAREASEPCAPEHPSTQLSQDGAYGSQQDTEAAETPTGQSQESPAPSPGRRTDGKEAPQAAGGAAPRTEEASSAADLPCGRCGGPCLFDTSVPSVLWNRVVRPLGGSEYLCASCVIAAFARAGVSFTAELHGGGFGGLPIAVEINGTAATVPLELNEENNRLRVRIQELESQLAAVPVVPPSISVDDLSDEIASVLNGFRHHFSSSALADEVHQMLVQVLAQWLTVVPVVPPSKDYGIYSAETERELSENYTASGSLGKPPIPVVPPSPKYCPICQSDLSAVGVPCGVCAMRPKPVVPPSPQPQEDTNVRIQPEPDHLPPSQPDGATDRGMGPSAAPDVSQGHDQNCPAFDIDGDDRLVIHEAQCRCRKRWDREQREVDPLIGSVVTAEAESIARIVADIDAWCRDERDDPPIDFICDLRDRLNGLAASPAGAPPPEEQIELLRKAVMLAIINIDCERNGLTPDGNVRERLVSALKQADKALAAVPPSPPALRELLAVWTAKKDGYSAIVYEEAIASVKAALAASPTGAPKENT